MSEWVTVNIGGKIVRRKVPANATDQQVRSLMAPVMRQYGVDTRQQAVLDQRTKPQSNEAYWQERLKGQGNLKAAPDTIRSRIGRGASGLMRIIASDERDAARLGEKVASAADWVPGLGDAMGLQEAWGDLKRGVNTANPYTVGAAMLMGGLSLAPGGLEAPIKRGINGLLKDEAGTFGGKMARTADLDALANAERMAEAGADRSAIWSDTGWFKGTDGKWRFEIDDSGAKLAKLDEVKLKQGVPLSKQLKHPGLADAYPEMARMPVKNRYDIGGYGYAGNYHEGTIGLSPSFYHSKPKERVTKVVGHEAQHGVQDLEGFAGGGNVQEFDQWPEAVANDALVLKTFIEKAGGADHFEEGLNQFRTALGREPDSFAPSVARQYEMQDLQQFANPKDAYRRLAGEVEARNVERRWRLTPQERRAAPPWSTQDVADEDQIIRF